MPTPLLHIDTELPGTDGAQRQVAMSVTYDPAAQTIAFALSSGSKSETFTVSCVSQWQPGPGGTLDGTHEIALDFGADDVRTRFDEAGLLGASFSTAATLASGKIVVRGPGQDGDWSPEAPRFELHLCWTLAAAIGAGSTSAQGASIAGDAQAEVCLGLAMIRPDWPGLGNFAVRLDTPSIGLTTGWLPLVLALDMPDLGDLPELRLDALVAWFARLLAIPDLPDWGITPPKLPAWSLDLPVSLDLPLGIGVEETRLWLREEKGGLAVDALARGFFLTWQGEQATDPAGEVSLTFDGKAYILKATLFRRHWPAEDGQVGQTYGFALPFDVLGLSARAWSLSFGVRLEGVAVGGTPRACFELLLEIGGLSVTSSLAQKEVYGTDLRLLILDRTVITNADVAGTRMFAAAPNGGGLLAQHFETWRQHHIPAQSFAARLSDGVPEDPANDYGVTFLDGTFSAGERVALLWQMNGARLVKALAHDLFGSLPADRAAPGETRTTYALEWLSEPDGTWQVRLDWRGAAPPSQWRDARKLDLPAIEDGCVIFGESSGGAGKPLNARLPIRETAAPAVGLDGRFDTSLSLSLPGLHIELARPQDQALVLTCPPGGDWSLSHLLLYPGAPKLVPDMPEVRAPVALAKVGFSVNDDGRKDLFETEDDAPFLTLAAGPEDPDTPFAIRSIGWRKGRSPRFLQTSGTGRGAAIRLIPDDLPAASSGPVTCPGPPKPLPAPGLVRFDDFTSPDLASWQMSIRLAADSALFRMFGASPNAEQSVGFRIDRICEAPDAPGEVLLHTTISVELGGASDVEGTVVFRFDLSDLSVRIDGEARLALKKEGGAAPGWVEGLRLPGKAGDFVYTEDMKIAGLTLTARRRRHANETEPRLVDMLALDMHDGRFVFGLPQDTDLILRHELNGDSIAFLVRTFALGPGGLDVEADLVSDAVQLPGLASAISLTSARLRMVGGRLDLLEIKGQSTLPQILESAPVAVTLVLDQGENGAIRLRRLAAELGDRGKPIFSRGTRFRFEIEELDLIYDGAAGQAWFEITGSASFRPHEGADADAFADGLIGELNSVTLTFTRLRLGDDPSVSISLMAELNTPVRFGLFGVFEMEIRSIGLNPRFDRFAEPAAAVLIGGQIRFADSGDVVQAEIDFHTLAIGLPRRGKAVPQIFAGGLRVVISTSEGFKIGGRLDEVDDGRQKGFLGEGVVQVPGLPELACGFAFIKVVDPRTGHAHRAWFIAVEASKISHLVGGALPIYLRQIGLGFGYRYTLPLIVQLSQIDEPQELIKEMLAALDRHQTLARIEAWALPEDIGPSRWTIALEGVLSLATTQSTPFDYSAASEREMRTIFAQILAAYRSDFTLVAAAKLWFPVSVDDFFNDRGAMRRRPLARGFIAYSAPRNRLVAHAAKSDNPYLGDADNQPFPMVLKAALDAVHYEVTLLVEPGLVHAELGWPDRLTFGLSLGPLSVRCRGGILIRLARDTLIYGYYFSASGELALSGGVDLGVVGVQIEALVSVTYATRLLIGAHTRRPAQSMLYGAIGLDLTVRFSLRAWLRIKLTLVSITLRISFSFSLQITVLGEIGWAGGSQVGFRGRATLSVQVFGRSLGLRVDVGINKQGVDEARKTLLEHAQSILEPGKTPVFPGLKEQRRTSATPSPGAVKLLAAPAAEAENAAPKRDDFVLSLRKGASSDAGTLWFGWIMPGPNGRAFYPVIPKPAGNGGRARYAEIVVPGEAGSEVFVREGSGWTKVANGQAVLEACPDVKVPLDDPLPDTPQGGDALTLNHMLAGAHVPSWKGDPDKAAEMLDGFPASWPHKDFRLEPATPEAAPAEPLHDPRVFDPASPARGPRRMLDPDDPWDAALTGEDAPGPANHLNEQALANQALLLQGFHDDLCAIAAATTWDGNRPETGPYAPGRPTLFDLGMILCIRTKGSAPPAWASERDMSRPALTLTVGGQIRPVRPVATFKHIDLTTTPPVLRGAGSVFDEETLAVAWRLDWAGLQPAAENFADGGSRRIEDYVEAYDISVVDPQTGAVLRETRVSHADIVVRREGGTVALRPRFGFSVPTQEILPRRADAQSRRQPLIVSMRPAGHTGTHGPTFSFAVDYLPTLTPMAAEEPVAILSMQDDGRWRAELTWRQPGLPDIGGVAETKGWRLVLRPLERTPFGAYPDAASDPTDRGALGASGTGTVDGDIQVPLGRQGAPGTHTVCLPDPINRRFYDHLGQPLSPDHPARKLAEGFFNRTSAARPDGRGWQLLLVATSKEDPSQPDMPLSAAPVSSAATVTLLMKQKGQPPRPLAHLEWPEPLDDMDRFVAAADLDAWAGQVNVPVAELAGKEDATFRFRRRAGTGRAVTVAWTALPSAEPRKPVMEPAMEPIIPQGVAAYTVHEWLLGDMVNRDAATSPPGGGYGTLRRIVPVEPGRARELPMTMHDVLNWEAQYGVKEAAPEEVKDGEESLLAWPDWIAAQETKAAQHGQDLARRPVHPGLALLLDRIATELGDLRIEVLDGPPPVAADPVGWLAASAAQADPYGWAALNALGLAVVLTARDPVTGLLVDQDKLLRAVGKAHEALASAKTDPAAGLAAAHLAVDLPVQHAQAYRADEQAARPEDIGLAMVQLSLRPLTIRRKADNPARTAPAEWIGLLARAFSRAAPDADDIEAALDADRQRLIDRLAREIDLTRYADWAARFFLPALPAGGKNDFRARVFAVQQRSVDPLLVAADGAATLRMTRFIDEQWASVRRYAVTIEGRYDRLYSRPETPPGPSAPSADVSLARVRPLETPAVLHLGIVRAQDGRPFHDVVVAHGEQILAARNHPVRTRLEFGLIRRSYDRAYVETNFYRNLTGPKPGDPDRDLLAGVALAFAKSRSEPGDPHDPHRAGDFAADTLLADVPPARWGARRYRDAAEPFYYRQTIRLEATAGEDVVAATGPLALPAQLPDTTAPMGDADPMTWQKRALREFAHPDDPLVTWTPEMTAERLERAAAWEAVLGKTLAAWFDTVRYDLELRLPRYAESLAPDMRATYFPHETVTTDAGGLRTAPAGLLPDAEARLLLVGTDEDRGTAMPLLQVQPVRNSVSDADTGPVPGAFQVQSVSADIAIENPAVAPAAGGDWTGGLWLSARLRPRQAAPFATTNLAGLPMIKTLSAEAELAGDALPDSGPLTCLAPLALRLVVQPPTTDSPGRVGLIEPIAAPGRGLTRPHLWTHPDALDPEPADVGDLAVALRLLLDVPRRRIAAEVAAERTAANAGRLLREIEAAAAVWKTGKIADDLQAAVSKALGTAPAGAVRLWVRDAAGWIAMPDGDGAVLPADPAIGPPVRLIVLMQRQGRDAGWQGASVGEAMAYWAYATSGLPRDSLALPDPSRSLEIGTLAEQVAAAAFRERTLERPQARVLRGNAPPQRWDRGEAAP